MPSFETHMKIARKDGISKEIMKEANELVDTFHSKKLGYSPRKAETLEVGLAPTIVKTAITTEDAESVKAVCHHYMLDFLQRKGYKYILNEAKNVGLKGIYDFLENDDEYHIQKISSEDVYPAESYLKEVREAIDKWKEVHRSEETNINESAKEFARIIKMKKE